MSEPAPVRDFVREALDYLHSASLKQALLTYRELVHGDTLPDQAIADIARGDRFFLLTHVLHRPDAIHPWLYERCREVEANTDGYLDLWARAHYKSTCISFAGAIQEFLNNPEITIGIFSHTKTIARKFTGQIKRELEQNRYLQQLYPDILWDNPKSQSPRWSEDGIIIQRRTNPAESTVEAWGLVDGQPIGKHFQLMIYDDVVVWESVQTAEQIAKTTSAWELSLNLGDTHHQRVWYIGTRYDMADTYKEIIERQAAIPRVYPATGNGQPEGKSVFLTQQQLDEKLAHMGLRTFAAQMLQNPAAGNNAEFSAKQYRQWEVRPKTINVYILCDYAGSRKTGSNRTAIAVIGVDANRNKYLLDGICHRLKLSERWKWLKHYHKKWINAPGVQVCQVGYERYGAQSDIEHFEQMMQIESYPFPITELSTPREGEISKDNRIRRIQPDHENWRWFYPYSPCLSIENGEFKWYPDRSEQITRAQHEAARRKEGYLVAQDIKHVDESERVYNLVKWFIDNEYQFFPTSKQKDFLDAMSRIYDMDMAPPVMYSETDVYPMPEAD